MSQTVGSNNNKVYRLVLTGGPRAGKTTGQARLCTFFESIRWRVYRVPETASLLTGGGVKTEDQNFTDGTMTRFYENLLKTVMQIEDTYFDLASTSTENCLVICDGGAMDIRAHMTQDQWQEMVQNNGWNDVDLRDSRYNQVVHMISAAADNDWFSSFGKPGDVDVEKARRRDDAMSQAWVGHPYYDVIDNATDFDRKIMRMIAAVCNRLDIPTGDRLSTDSVKRKFLIRELPDVTLFPQFKDFTVVHDYLVTPNQKMQARIRRRGQNDNWTYTHTIRCPRSSKEPPELKMQVTAREYELLLAQKDVDHYTVYKTRRCFLWNNQYFQLDIYEDPCPNRCKGLILLETYTSLKGDEFHLPMFLDVEREVTGDPSYSMYNLSKKEPQDLIPFGPQVSKHVWKGGDTKDGEETSKVKSRKLAGKIDHSSVRNGFSHFDSCGPNEQTFVSKGITEQSEPPVSSENVEARMGSRIDDVALTKSGKDKCHVCRHTKWIEAKHSAICEPFCNALV